MTKNIMIDLETLGTDEDSVILSIGAAAFNETGVYDKFYKVIDVNCLETKKRTIDPDTVKWWMRQSEDARHAFDAPGVDLKVALIQFNRFVKDCSEPDCKLNMWGNGSDFDNRLLAHAYRQCHMNPPWSFWENRCYRTMKSLFDVKKPERKGAHHNALDDAVFQAEHLIAILTAIAGA